MVVMGEEVVVKEDKEGEGRGGGGGNRSVGGEVGGQGRMLPGRDAYL